MKQIKRVLFSIALLALIYGGAHFYLQYKVKSDLDKAITTASPFVDISYRDVSSDLLAGSFTVEGLEVTPKELTEGISIGQVIIRGDGIGFLYRLAADEFGSEPPSQLQLEYRRMVIPFGLMDSASFGPQLGQAGTSVAKACTLAGILQHVGLEDLGHEQFVADGFFRYRLASAGNGLTAEMAYNLQGIEYSRIEVDVSGAISPTAMALGAMPTLNSIRMQYQLDAEFSRNMITHCATKSGQDASTFLDALLPADNPRYGHELGFIPGPGIRSVLKKLVGSASELVITANPSPNLTFENIGLYKPNQLLELFDVEVTIDDQIVTDLSYQLSTKSQELLVQLAKSRESESKPEKKVQRKRVIKRFLPIKANLLKDKAGRELKIYTTQTEKPREGVLTAISDRVVTVEQRIFGGKVELHVPIKKIQRVEILTSIQID